jgi:hypothetical protein
VKGIIVKDSDPMKLRADDPLQLNQNNRIEWGPC